LVGIIQSLITLGLNISCNVDYSLFSDQNEHIKGMKIGFSNSLGSLSLGILGAEGSSIGFPIEKYGM
jgi:hypothetical protein